LQNLEFPQEQLEIIVVDNGSIDGSSGFIRSRFPEVVLLQNETNLGFSKAANQGAESARGEYLAFLNNDMRVDKKWLSVLLNIARAGSGFASVGSTILNWDGSAVDFNGRTDDAFCLAYEPSEDDAKPTSDSVPYFPTLFASGGAALIQRNIFRELGGFDPDLFIYHEDVDLGWRLWLRGHECVLSSESIVYHRSGASSSKISAEHLHKLSQKHTLISVFKNLDDPGLREILPLILYLYLERSRWVPAARESLTAAIEEFQSSLSFLVAKRKEIQSARVKSDAAIFALVGHPFNFLLRQESYKAVRERLLNSCRDLKFDPADADSVRFAVSEWLNKSHFLFESRLREDFARQLEDKDLIIRARDETVIQLQEQMTETVTQLQQQVGETENRNLALAVELSTRTNELHQIKQSFGWRMLSRYGQFKYRRLLPMYRMLKLPPYSRNREGGEQESDQLNGQGTQNPFEPGSGTEQVAIPLESNAYDVICFPIIEWDFRFQRPQQMMSRFAEAGHRVFYVKQTFSPSGPAYKVHEKIKNIYEVSLRGPSRVVYDDSLDDRACDALFASLDTLRRDVLLGATVAFVQLPFWWPLARKSRVEFDWPIVYDCMDHHASFSTNRQAMLDHEPDLLSSADLVLASSEGLQTHVQEGNKHVLLLRNACDYDHFTKARYTRNPRPVIGYYGAIADWFDSDLVADLAERRPDWEFVLVGSTFSADVRRLAKLSNVFLTGEKPYSEIPEWLGKFDVVIIPFKRTPLTEATNPVKAYEILAAGKPLVSVPIPEMQTLSGLVRLASSAKEFEKEISAALTDNDPQLIERRRAFARANTWEQRYEVLAPAVRDLFPKASIVIVTFNNLDLNRLNLQSVYARTEWPSFEVIVVDNNSTDGTPEYLKQAERTFPNLQVILNDSNRGFAAANNIGLGKAKGDYLVLLNNDTVVTRGWLSTLIRHLNSDPTIGLIGPVTNNIGNEAKVDIGYAGLKEMPAWAADFIRQHDGQVFPIPMLAMFCLAMRREVFEQVGLLDEQFGIGMFEDDDYTHRVKLSGLQVVCASDSFVHHFGQAAFKKLVMNGEYQSLFENNRRRYEQKWEIEWIPHQYAPSKE
jgi:GT2 family glycosyltransferase